MSDATRPQRNPAAPVAEILEERLLLSLLGVGPQIQFPDVFYDSTGTLSYNADTHVLRSDAVPTSIVFTAGTRPVIVQAPKDFWLTANIDNAGLFMGGGTNQDLYVEGQVDLNSDGIMEYSGVLLTARVAAFGYLNGASTDQYDFRLIPTGGQLMSFFANKDIGLTMNSLNSTFTGSFAANFTGRAQGLMGNIAPQWSSLSGSVTDEAGQGVATAVRLTGTDIVGAAVDQLATSGTNGAFTFGNLRPGTYTLTETQPAGLLDGDDAAGSLGGTAGDDAISGIAVSAAQAGTGYAFTEVQPASLSGTVMVAGVGIAGVDVRLTGIDDRGGEVSALATSGIDGAFTFAGLRPGTYTMTETQPAGLLDGDDAAGSLGGTVADDVISGIVVSAAQAGTGYAFTEVQPASLGGTVMVAGVGIAGVDVRLTGIDDRGGELSALATSGIDGAFTFAGLRPGTYTMTETAQPAGLLDGDDAAGSLGGTAGDDVISGIVVAAAQAGTGYAFTEVQPASLSGIVWVDTNDDGMVDFGEKSLPGVTVQLAGTDDRGQQVEMVQQTDEDGAAIFLDLRPGTYSVSELQPAGYDDGVDLIGTAGGVLGQDAIQAIGLAEGVDAYNYNFGERPMAGAALTQGQTATIGFWQNKNGQSLILSLNGSTASTQLGNWLAATFPNMFAMLAGKSNADVAALYQSRFKQKGQKLDAQVMATALACYVTSSDLAGTAGSRYGFIVTQYGAGIATYNIGTSGLAFGVSNYSVLSIMDILLASDSRSTDGLLFNGNTLLRNLANTVYDGINNSGDIG